MLTLLLIEAIMEVEQFYNLPSATWRSRRAGSIIHSKSKVLRTRSSSAKAGEYRCSSSNNRAEGKSGEFLLLLLFYFYFFFILFRYSVKWSMPRHMEEYHLLYWFHLLLNTNLTWKHPHRQTKNNV